MRKVSGRAVLLATLAMLLFGAATKGSPDPIELKAKTLEAFERYAHLTEARHNAELRRGSPFLWVDGLAEAQRGEAYARLREGKIRIERLETRDGGSAIQCPDGLIHHWVGIIFIPGITLNQTLQLVQDYDHHAKYYWPDVMRSKTLERRGNDFKVYLRFLRKKVITVVLDTEHDVHYSLMDATHAESRSRTTRVAEIENAGKANEREKPAGEGGGYLWAMDTWWRFIERDGGTYVQCESVSLTRDIPTGLGWLVGPFVNSIPRESLTFTLTATRRALTGKTGGRESTDNRHALDGRIPNNGPGAGSRRAGWGASDQAPFFRAVGI